MGHHETSMNRINSSDGLLSRLWRRLRPFYLKYLYLLRFPEETPFLHPELSVTDEGYRIGKEARCGLASRQARKNANQLIKHIPSTVDQNAIHIVFPPLMPWGAMMQRPHHIARFFARAGAVCWFGIPRYVQKPPNPVCIEEDGVFTLKEPFRLLNGLPNENIWFWISSPLDVYLLDTFKKAHCVYDVYDHPQLHRSYGKALLEDHHRLIQEADIVTASAEALKEEIQPIRPDVILVKNGVYTEDFQDGKDITDVLTSKDLEFTNRYKSTVIYAGALAPWFDWDLLALAADTNPDIGFLLIGAHMEGDAENDKRFPPSCENLWSLCKRRNIHWGKSKAYRELPGYLNLADAAIIPFKTNDIMDAVSPVKLFEYAAMGLPVISTDLRECRQEELCTVCKDADKFASALPAACEKGKEEYFRNQQKQLVQTRTWEKRLRPVYDAILGTPKGKVSSEI